MYTAALQAHVPLAPDVIPRQAFLKYAIEAQCPLTFPFPGSGVVVMRKGLLRHLDRYMQLLGLAEAPDAPAPPAHHWPEQDRDQAEEEGDEKRGGGGGGRRSGAASKMKEEEEDEEEEEEGSDMDEDGEGGEGGAGPSSAASGGGGRKGKKHKSAVRPAAPAALWQLCRRVREETRPGLRAAWEGLRQRVQALRPVERYVVRSVAYRQHLADAGDCEEDAATVNMPIAWLFLRPAQFGPRHQLPQQVGRGGVWGWGWVPKAVAALSV